MAGLGLDLIGELIGEEVAGGLTRYAEEEILPLLPQAVGSLAEAVGAPRPAWLLGPTSKKVLALSATGLAGYATGSSQGHHGVRTGIPDNVWHRIDPGAFEDPYYRAENPEIVPSLGHLYPLDEGSSIHQDYAAAGQVQGDIIDGSLINSTPNMPLPGKGTKRASGVEISTDAPTKKAKARHTPKSANKSIAAQTVSTAQVYYDSHLLMPGSSEKRLTRLNLKLGKQLYPDVITPFLENLMGKGTVRMQFVGRCVSAVGKRHNHFQMFRHRLSEGSGYNTQATTTNDWPPAFKNHILTPHASKSFYPSGTSGGTNPGAPFPYTSTAWRDITTNECYWAPYNLADLEDCSWNLNALKLRPANYNTSGPVNFADQAITFLAGNHYRSGVLAYNNYLVATTVRPPTYRYKAVINKGSICYDFMNKGTGGAKVELIVYRVKKTYNPNWSPPTGSSADMNFINKEISGPIGIGYVETCLAKAATDNLGGRPPVVADVIDNPQFPLLPQLRKTKQNDLGFAEVSRQTFAMPSGSRREMNIELPGLVYDPTNKVTAGPDPSQSTSTPSVFDQYTYGVFISCCGVVCTDEMHTGTPAIAYNVGDMISQCDVQFYCTYTEHIGACSYKPENKPILYSAGTIIDNAVPGTPATIVEVPVTMLDQGSAIRTPATLLANSSTQSAGPGYNMANDVKATPAS